MQRTVIFGIIHQRLSSKIKLNLCRESVKSLRDLVRVLSQVEVVGELRFCKLEMRSNVWIPDSLKLGPFARVINHSERSPRSYMLWRGINHRVDTHCAVARLIYIKWSSGLPRFHKRHLKALFYATL